LGARYYQYNWKTRKGATGCATATLSLPDGYDAEPLTAEFQYRK